MFETNIYISEAENLLALALKEVALEMRSIEVIDLITYLHMGKLETVADLLSSSLELYYKPGVILFSYTGEASLTWFGKPRIMFDMELHSQGCDIFFQLIIESIVMSVKIQQITIDGVLVLQNFSKLRLEQAIKAARQQPALAVP